MAVDIEQRPLKVTIIGAGIAGLTAALALRKQGHVVTVRIGWSCGWDNC
jgi:salicylate hydroxylase